MKIKYYLKRPEVIIQTSMYALINYNSTSLKIYIGESIEPVYWNSETGKAELPKSDKGDLLKTDKAGNKILTDKAKKLELETLNDRLGKIISTIKETFKDYQNRNKNLSPSPSILKPLIETALGRGMVKKTFLDYFQEFTDLTLAGKRIDPKSKKPVRLGVAKGYRTTLKHLRDFNKGWNKKLDFETVDIDFHSAFTQYLTDSPVNLSANTIGDHIKRIKAVMAEATEKGLNANMKFKSRLFLKQNEETDAIYLNAAELKEMRELDLTDNPKLDNVRDLFLIGANTGLRHSDLAALKIDDITNGFIRVNQIKTSNPVIIPVNEVVNGVIDKYDNNLPRAISKEKMNLYLKELGQLMPSLKQKVEITRTTGGMKVTTVYEKWKLLVTHTMRRSFATNEYLDRTLDTLMIMSITGHKTEKSFLKYIKVTPEEQANRILNLIQQRDNRNKLRVA